MLLRCVIIFILFQNKCRDYILYFKIDNHSFAKISSLCNECPSERGFQPLSRRVECAPTVGFRSVCRKGYINSVKRGKIWPPERSSPCVVKGAEPVMHGSKRGIVRFDAGWGAFGGGYFKTKLSGSQHGFSVGARWLGKPKEGVSKFRYILFSYPSVKNAYNETKPRLSQAKALPYHKNFVSL